MMVNPGKIVAGLILYLLTPWASMAGVSVVSGLTYENQAQPGGSYQGSIKLANTGAAPLEVKLYQTDYLFSYDGKVDFGEPGQAPRSNANWITFSPQRLTIPPQGTSQVNYTVIIPNDQSLVGTYWSVLMIEGISASSPEAAKQNQKASMGITQIIRYGAQIRTQIGDTGARKLKILKTTLLKEAAGRILQIDVENIGERFLFPNLWVDLYDQKGQSIGKFEAVKQNIYPTTSVRFRIDLSRVPAGSHKALVVLDCGGDDLFGASYTLNFE